MGLRQVYSVIIFKYIIMSQVPQHGISAGAEKLVKNDDITFKKENSLKKKSISFIYSSMMPC